MKKSLIPFILFGLVIIAAGCKTAPEDKKPEPTPVETAKASASDTQATQTENKSETMQNSATTAMLSNSEKVEPKKNESQKAEAKTPTSTQVPAQKVTPRKTTAQSGSAAKSKTASQVKNTQTKPAKQGSAQQKPAKSNVPGASAAKNTQPKSSKQGQTEQKTSKSKAVGEKTQKKGTTAEVAKKETAKTASDKQNTAAKAAPAKQSENKKAETKGSAAHIAAAQITDILWMIEQADASFVSKQHKGAGKMFVTMFAKYKGDLTAQDFHEAFFASPADMWSLDEKNAKGLLEINKKDKLLTLKHLAAGEGEGAAALGKWFASVTLAGQKPFEKELNVTGIGGQAVTGAAGKTVKEKSKKTSFIVPSAKAENEQQALAMPVIRSVSRDADTIEIIFSVNDSRVKNAYFYFDVPGEEYYRDSGSMIDATGKPVNGCRSFSTDGKKCQYVLRKDATNKDWFGKATQCFLVVSDVNRVASPWEERHRTISAASRIAK